MSAYTGTLTSEQSRQQRKIIAKLAQTADQGVSLDLAPSHLGTSICSREVPNVDSSKDVYEFDVITNRAEFEALEDDWNLLFKRFGQPHHVFLTFNWCWHWCSHFLDFEFSKKTTDKQFVLQQKLRLFVVTARRNGQLVMLWPLVREKKFGINRLCWLGRNISQYGDAIVADIPDKTELLRQGWDYLAKNGNCDVVSLSKVRDDSNISSLLALSGAVSEAEELAPYLKLREKTSVDQYLIDKSSKAARNRRRKRRRLEEKGEVLFEVIKPGKQAQKIVSEALEMKRLWLKNTGQFSRALSDPITDAFFLDVASDEKRGVGTRISKLSVDGQNVAIEIGFVCKGAVAIHIIVYDHKFNKYSCGSLAMEESIRACWDDGLSTYDLLAPHAPYKMDWADQTIGVKDWHKPISVKGKIWLWLNQIAGKQSIKSVMSRLPMVVRQPVSQLISRLCGLNRA